MRISRRARNVAPFYAMEMAKAAAALAATGVDVIRLNLGEPDFGALPAVREALRAGAGRPFAYTSAVGNPDLREAIADYYTGFGASVDPRQVVVTAGASGALLLLCAALVDPGDRVLVADPSYPCNREFLAGFGADVALVPTTAATGYQLDADLVARHWDEATTGVLVATPSNPTGTSVPAAELTAISQVAASRGGWRIVDEIYLGLADHDANGNPPTSVLAGDPGACVVNSFSKYFGMTGWRLGWAIIPPDLVEVMERLAQNYFICAPVPAQEAALACFTPESLAICEQRRLEFADRRHLVLEGLAAIGIEVDAVPDGAFYVYFDVAGIGMDSDEFCRRALAEGVALTPGKDFGVRTASTHVRLSYAASRAELQEGIARLARVTRA